MTRNAFIAAILLAPCLAAAAQMPARPAPAPDFEKMIHWITDPLQAKDPFAGVEQCSVVDARTFVPVSARQARQMLRPCVRKLAQRYHLALTLDLMSDAAPGTMSTQVEGLALYVPQEAPVTSMAMRDLEYGLRLRRFVVLGQPIVLRRGPVPPTEI
ncbi:MAG: hypothetical protein KGO96_04710 [Elusimicrobia bacterium]|nr:hypothetical protein [Elusimicrobiota bacterium]MDE2238003.1 hypothetical protein [Elusimicrobiota bacterium]MDE2425192.1 hypothetical protein [Elusimicrobiota bacterium]